MKLHSLNTNPGQRSQRKRKGRGRSSGMGKTCGRGTKGQLARKGSSRKPGFEGGQMPLYRRIPKRGFNNPGRKQVVPVNVGDLARFPEGSEVGLQELRACGLVNGPCDEVKILGAGELDRPLTVSAHAFSKTARAKIEAAGGACRHPGG